MKAQLSKLMKSLLLLMALLLTETLLAQPPNDECSGATAVSLTTPPNCPNTSFVTNIVNSTNVNATPTSPYPVFTGCTPGGTTDGPAAEVWFTFTATGGNTEIQITGALTNPNMVLYQGSNCGLLIPIACASGGSGLTLLGSTIPGQQYYLMVSGGDLDDQGSFQLRFRSSRLCGVCYQPDKITVEYNPPPVNGTYSSGQTVQICVTVNEWIGNAAGTIEWLHAVTFEFGDSWDVDGLVPNPPSSCDGSGTWGWYDSWVGCNTGQTYGPGFAYDSASGVGCGGSPNDGDPGNNWGDGNGPCSNIPDQSPPVTFCMNITVNDCPPAVTGGGLGLSVQLLSDGDSGSWNQTGCNSNQGVSFLASVICCDDEDPTASTTDATCPGVADGSITVSGNAGLDPSMVFNYTILSSGQEIVYECVNCPTTVTTPNNLASGVYTVLATNISTNCSRSVIVVIDEGPQPVAMAELSNMPCQGEPGILMGNIDPPDPAATYAWSGPGGFSSSDQNPEVLQEGTYSLTVTSAAGCVTEPVTVDVSFIIVEAEIDAPIPYACLGSPVELSASGGTGYSWENTTTGEPLGNSPNISPVLPSNATIQVTVTDDNGCSDIASIEIEVIDPPDVTFNITGDPCQGGNGLVITASGAGPGGSYTWLDDPNALNPRLISPSTPAGTYTLGIGAVNALGCISTAQVTYTIVPPINAQLTALPDNICVGQSTTLTASGGTLFNWSTGLSNGPSTISVTPAANESYTVTVSNSSGCVGTASVDVNVSVPPDAPEISCGPSSNSSVSFFWLPVDGAVSYDFSIDNGPVQNTTENSVLVENLNSGQLVFITVTPVFDNPGPCAPVSATFSCEAVNCPAIAISINPVNDICLNAAVSILDLQATTGSPGGVELWSGNGITDAAQGLFDPTVAGPGTHLITLTYTLFDCEYTATTSIEVFANPTSTFSISPNPACISDTLLLVYTGNAPASATFHWDFGGAFASPGTGIGPHQLSWTTDGSKTVSLWVEAAGCTSDTTSVTSTLEVPVEPVISCGPATTTSVSFVWNQVAGATGYNVEVLSGQSGQLTDTTFMVSNLSPGEVVSVRLITLIAGACQPVTPVINCAAQDCPDFVPVINPIADICLYTTVSPDTLTASIGGSTGSGQLIWSGPGITDSLLGIFDPAIAGAGSHILHLRYSEGPCFADTSLTVNVFDIPTASFSLSSDSLCVQSPMTVTYTGTASAAATYSWAFASATAIPGSGQGPQQLSWASEGERIISLTVTENNCTSTIFADTIFVGSPLPPPIINCNTTVSSIVFSWNPIPGASGYQVNVLSGSPGILQDTSYTVTGLNPNDQVSIEVIAQGDGPCGNSVASATCVAIDCPDVQITFPTINPVCLSTGTASINLTATITGGSGGGIFTWSGPGVADGALPSFSPATAGVGTHIISLNYREGNCSYNNSFSIIVNPQPTASFTVSGPVCTNTPATVTYTGSADGSAIYNWNFGGGTALPGTGAGPHLVSWTTAGTPSIELTVSENNCLSVPFNAVTTVEAPLSTPVISCSSTLSSVTFSWPAVAGANTYDVLVLQGPTGVLTGTSYTVVGLLPGQAVRIRLTALTNNVCGPVSAEFECAALSCPNFTFGNTSYGPYCLDAGTQTLIASVSGGQGNGQFSWSGTGIVAASGTFNPAVAGVGQHPLQLTYTEGNCSASTTYLVTVLPKPAANFSVESPICVNTSGPVTYLGGASPTATYNWDFAGGTATPGTGAGPHQIQFATVGITTMSLVVVEQGCASNPFSQIVQVNGPLTVPAISCQSVTTSSIVFSWPAVPGATSYNVDVLSGPMGTLSGTTYTVTGLNPDEVVSIQLTVNGNTACGPVTAVGTCAASACPPLDLSINAPTNLCAGQAANLTFAFNPAISGPLNITYTVNNGPVQSLQVSNGQQLTLNNLQTATQLNILSISSSALPNCNWPAPNPFSIAVDAPPSAGTPSPPTRICQGTQEIINLFALLNNEQTGGFWEEAGGTPSAGSAFNATSASLATANLQAGTYSFRYTVPGGTCPPASAVVNVDIIPAPIADAGSDQFLNCNLTAVSIGGNNTSSGSGITYQWSVSPDSIVFANPNLPTTQVSQPGVYTLVVTNADGCTAQDATIVSADYAAPVANVRIVNISCYGANDGVIIIESVSGGQPPYRYALDEDSSSVVPIFSGLSPGSYELSVIDQNGCSGLSTVNIAEPGPINALLTSDLMAEEAEPGQAITLQLIINPNTIIDTILWQPDGIATGNVQAVTIFPQASGSYSATVIDVKGCRDQDDINIIVRKSYPVYIPNAFSPNGDGVNDVLFIQAADGRVNTVRRFMIVSRWGETVFSVEGGRANDPSQGWDGRFRGEALNPAVFTYYAELEFNDGEIIQLTGDVSLLK